MSRRVSDFALIVGHAWRCTSCRESLIGEPSALLIGYKLSETQRTCLLGLDDESFQTVMKLADITGLSADELYEAIDHPRARLRHLGSIRYEQNPTRR